MSIPAKLSAWWAAWKWVAVLLVLCAGLAALNLWQWHLSLTRPIREENKSLASAIRLIEGMAERRDHDDAELLADLTAIAERARSTRVIYREAAAAAPLPSGCGPGQARIDAVNRALGASPEKRQ